MMTYDIIGYQLSRWRPVVPGQPAMSHSDPQAAAASDSDSESACKPPSQCGAGSPANFKFKLRFRNLKLEARSDRGNFSERPGGPAARTPRVRQ